MSETPSAAAAAPDAPAPTQPHTRQSSQHAPNSAARHSRPDPKDDALAIFNDVVGKGPSNTSPDATAGATPWDLTTKIGQLCRLTTPADERLRTFETEIWPSLRAMGSPLPQHLYLATVQLLKSIGRGLPYTEGHVDPGGPLLFSIYDWLGKLDLTTRAGIILNTCLNLERERDGPDAVRDALGRDLLTMWQSLSQMRRPTQKGKPPAWALPDRDHVTKLMRAARGDDATAIAAILHQFPRSEAREALPCLLLTTLAVCANRNLVSNELLREFTPLLELSRIVLPQCDIDETFINNHVLRSKSANHVGRHRAPLERLVQRGWSKGIEKLLQNPGRWREGRGSTDSGDKPASEGVSSLSNFFKQARRALRRDNTGALVSTWRKLRTALELSESRSAEARDDPDFMDYWHHVWCAQQQPDLLQETTEVMEAIGLRPTIKTYTSMMHGWKLSRDTAKMDAMWDMLLASGMQLDAHAWTARISGLIELGQVQRGIDTLGDMMDRWNKASSGHGGLVNPAKAGSNSNQKATAGQPATTLTPTAVQPTIQVVNAAFKPLLRNDKQTAYAVLKWAGEQGIKPDERTYNALLGECVRSEGSEDEVRGLLKTMRDDGVEPDAATFTILLNKALGNLAQVAPGEQVAAIDQIMADIRAAGVTPNLETLGKMLHAAAGLPSSGPAVKSVLAHTLEAGHDRISPHMALILVTRHLAEPHPSSAGVKSILARHGFGSLEAGDQRLWEHVISAYVGLGDTASAMDLYHELRAAGRPLNRQFSLRDLLVVLIENEQWDDARLVVRNALVEAAPTDGDRGWRHHFWHAAYRWKLLDWDTAPAGVKRVVDQRRYLDEAEGVMA